MSIPSPYALAYLFAATIVSVTFLGQSAGYAQVTSPAEQPVATSSPPQLPSVSQKIVTAVYPFRLSTDQPLLISPQTTPQATAIATYTNLLFEVLRTSNWFSPTPHGQAGELLNERPDKSTPLPADSERDVATSKPPGLILEAGLFSHEVTSVSPETGAGYFPTGGPNTYRQDRATIFLRAISPQSGKIVKTIYWTRTVLSQLTGGSTYRYVLINRPNPPLTGLTSVSPDQIAIAEGIKQAVRGLIIEGVRDGEWAAVNMSATQLQMAIAAYEAEKMNAEDAGQPDQTRRVHPAFDPSFVNVHLYGGLLRYHGDYVNWDTKGMYGLSVEAYVTPYIGLQLNAMTGTLASYRAFSTHITAAQANLVVRVLPYWRLTPVVYGGLGVVSRSTQNPLTVEGSRYFQYQGGLGLQYSVSSVIGFRAMLSYNQPNTDQLDGLRAGSHNDFYVQTTLGLLIQFGRYVPKSN